MAMPYNSLPIDWKWCGSWGCLSNGRDTNTVFIHRISSPEGNGIDISMYNQLILP